MKPSAKLVAPGPNGMSCSFCHKGRGKEVSESTKMLEGTWLLVCAK